MTAVSSRDEIASTIDTAKWSWLRAHLERGGLIVVSQDLDLVEAGFGIASDDTVTVSDWVEKGKVTKPSAVQVFDWDAEPETLFRVLIVSPYVLMQQMPQTFQ